MRKVLVKGLRVVTTGERLLITPLASFTGWDGMTGKDARWHIPELYMKREHNLFPNPWQERILSISDIARLGVKLSAYMVKRLWQVRRHLRLYLRLMPSLLMPNVLYGCKLHSELELIVSRAAIELAGPYHFRWPTPFLSPCTVIAPSVEHLQSVYEHALNRHSQGKSAYYGEFKGWAKDEKQQLFLHEKALLEKYEQFKHNLPKGYELGFVAELDS